MQHQFQFDFQVKHNAFSISICHSMKGNAHYLCSHYMLNKPCPQITQLRMSQKIITFETRVLTPVDYSVASTWRPRVTLKCSLARLRLCQSVCSSALPGRPTLHRLVLEKHSHLCGLSYHITVLWL